MASPHTLPPTATLRTGTPAWPPETQYPNDQPSTTLWYHDHAMTITRLNVMAGLAGFYLIRDPQDAALTRNLYEIP